LLYYIIIHAEKTPPLQGKGFEILRWLMEEGAKTREAEQRRKVIEVMRLCERQP